MSDETSARNREAARDWLVAHRERYLGSGGVEGHIEDLTLLGGHAFGTHCMIRYTGRKTGKVFITPLCYGDIGGEVVIVASKGGADVHPQWYLNLQSGGGIEFQIATQAYTCTWREPKGAERQKVWDFMVSGYPFYANYEASTSREIPLVMMTPVKPIPVFKDSDATGVRQI